MVGLKMNVDDYNAPNTSSENEHEIANNVNNQNNT